MRGIFNRGFESESKTQDTKDSEKEEQEHKERRSKKIEIILIYKNLLVISLAFLLLFIAFESITKLQSSINAKDNLGTWSTTAVYASLVLSCMFVPSVLINKLKEKWSLVVCVLCYTTYMAAQFYPEFYTLIPTAIVLGLGAAPLWSAKCTYLTKTAKRLAQITNVDSEPIVVRFFGIFFFIFQCNAIIGNIISTVVLSEGKNKTEISDEELLRCGPNYCPTRKSYDNDTAVVEDVIAITKNLNFTDLVNDIEGKVANSNFETDLSSIYKLAGVYLACSVCASLMIAIFVNPLSRFQTEESQQEGHEEKLTGFSLVIATFRHMMKPEQMMVIPITFWSGVEQGFFGADFTAGFITCVFGAHYVGRVLICYGVLDALGSVGFGYLIKYMGRVPIFVLGALINISVIITLMTWSPSPEQEAVIYVLAGLWGLADAIWQTQINALYGVLFPNTPEAAFSNYRLWESLGFVLAFITQACGVCVFDKLIVAIVLLSIGMSGYFAMEYYVKFIKAKNSEGKQ